MKKLTLVLTIFIVLFFCGSLQKALAWERLGKDVNLTEHGVENAVLLKNSLVVATKNAVYIENELGLFEKMFLERATIGIEDLVASEKKFFVFSRQGVFKFFGSSPEPTRISHRKEITGGIAGEINSTSFIFVWHEDRVFRLIGDHWQDITPRIVDCAIIDAAIHNDKIYFLTEGGIISYSEDGLWKRVNAIGILTFRKEDPDRDEASEKFTSINSYDNNLLVMTDRSVYLNVRGGWKKITSLGMSGIIVDGFVSREDQIYTIAGSDAYMHLTGENRWKGLNVPSGDLRKILVASEGIEKKVFVLAGGRLYRKNIENRKAAGEDNVFSLNIASPAVTEVQKMAIDYAKVSPEKIRSWRKRAAWKGVLPQVRFDYKRSMDDNIDIYTSVTTNYIIEGPREIDDEFAVRLTWDLGDIIWNRDQTAIDVRSRLMVRLRMQILEEVNRLYFERERLINSFTDEVFVSEESFALKKLKIAELDGYLDALTGGAFSRSVASMNRHR